MIIKAFAWIPRSYVHAAEIYEKAKKGIGLELSNIKHGKKISFDIKEFNGYKNISFSLDGEGLYSLRVKVPEKKVEESANKFLTTARNLIMNIIKKCHRVTYTQIVEGILPINFAEIVFMSKDHRIKDYSRQSGGGLVIYTKPEEVYMKDSITFISGRISKKKETLCNYQAFTNIASQFFYEMMNKMESYHQGTKEVIRLLEYEPNNKAINNAYLNLDLVKKDAAESWAKIEQGIDCFLRKKRKILRNKLTGTLKDFSGRLRIKEKFRKISADKDYVKRLWHLLINHLNHVDTAVEARVSFSRMNAYRANQWLGIINLGFVLGAVLMALFMINAGLLNNIRNFIILVVGWVVFYELTNYVVLKRNA